MTASADLLFNTREQNAQKYQYKASQPTTVHSFYSVMQLTRPECPSSSPLPLNPIENYSHIQYPFKDAEPKRTHHPTRFSFLPCPFLSFPVLFSPLSEFVTGSVMR